MGVHYLYSDLSIKPEIKSGIDCCHSAGGYYAI
jgi:hypothetical protein